MKQLIFLLTAVFLLIIHPLGTYSKDNKAMHNFKIVGRTKLKTPNGVKTVEYDPISPDHLFITNFSTDGKIASKRQFIFTGKKFDLTVNFLTYKDKNEILLDGSHAFYKNGSIQKTIIYKKDEPVMQNFFHPNGQMESTIPGIDFLNGEYKMWHSNGQLSFSGNYKDNLKNGEFEQFDESGTLLKKGVYQDGKLVDGEPIAINTNENQEVSESLQDEKIYTSVDIMPEFPGGPVALQRFIATSLRYPIEAQAARIQGKVFVGYVVDTEGNVVDVKLVRGVHPSLDAEAIRVVKMIPKYSPGMLKGKAVRVGFTLPVNFISMGVINKSPR